MSQVPNDISEGNAGRINQELTPDSVWEDASFDAYSLITSRQNISPKRLDEPGPSQQALTQIFCAAAAAPDHGLLQPWRFVIVPQKKRVELAEVFALALIDRDPGATLDQIESAREKAYRAPCLILVVARLGSCEPPIPELERMVSVGCAVQNMLLMAQSLSFGSGITSGRATNAQPISDLFQLSSHEEGVCFVAFGKVTSRKPQRPRPDVTSFVSSL